MTPSALLVLIAGLGVIGWLVAKARAQRLNTRRDALHSLPGHHGWYLALWIILPALLGFAVWGSVSPGMIHSAVLADPGAAALGLVANPVPARAPAAPMNLAGEERLARARRAGHEHGHGRRGDPVDNVGDAAERGMGAEERVGGRGGAVRRGHGKTSGNGG